MRSVAVAALVCAACGPRATPSNAKTPDAGIAISLYRDGDRAYGVVDDRRWVELSGTSLLLANIDPGAALASLVIESANPKLRIGPCMRQRLPDVPDPSKVAAYEAAVERKQAARVPRRYRQPEPARPEPRVTAERFAPIVQCDVSGPPGRHLVRVVYVSTELTYRVQHDIEVLDPSKAVIESRFAFKTPHWRERAEVTAFDGIPGGVEPPRELVRGMVTLDGGTSVLGVGAREVPAQLRRIFSGIPFDDTSEEDYSIDTLSVWATLELPGVELAPGPMRVHVQLDDEDRWIDIPVLRKDTRPGKDSKATDEPLRIKLWVDSELRGGRQRVVVENDGTRIVEIVSLSMSSSASVPREVWLEEHARPAKRRSVERAWPKKPTARGNVLRNKVTVKPGRVERAGYTLVYEQ